MTSSQTSDDSELIYVVVKHTYEKTIFQKAYRTLKSAREFTSLSQRVSDNNNRNELYEIEKTRLHK